KSRAMANTQSKQDSGAAARNRTRASPCRARALESLAKLTRIQFPNETPAIKRHSGSFLRKSSICVGRNFCDGLHWGERRTGWDSHGGGNGGRDAVHNSCLLLCGSTWPRAIRGGDVHHVHSLSDQLADVTTFFGVDRRVHHSRSQRVWRYFAQSADHRI